MVSHAHLGTAEPAGFWWTVSHQSLVQSREASEALCTRTSQLGVCEASVWYEYLVILSPLVTPGPGRGSWVDDQTE